MPHQSGVRASKGLRCANEQSRAGPPSTGPAHIKPTVGWKSTAHTTPFPMCCQMEALLREKAELAAANARLARENESLHELLDYHQGSEDYDDYEQMQPH
jgi:hypothetical protein